MPRAKEYTEKELNILKRKHLSDEQVAKMINRSENAIHQKRLSIAKLEKKYFLKSPTFKKSKKLSKGIYGLPQDEIIRIKGEFLEQHHFPPSEPTIPSEFNEESDAERQDLLPLFEINGVVIVIDKERNEVTITY